MKTIKSAAGLYAHAIAIEQEAVERYSEFAQRMADLGNDAVAEIFANLAKTEANHLQALERRADGMVLPLLARGEYCWLDAGSPEAAARELIFRLMTPRQALAIALEAEKQAQAFFEHVVTTAPNAALGTLAREMAIDEQEHVAMIERALAHTPKPVDWPAVYDSNPSGTT